MHCSAAFQRQWAPEVFPTATGSARTNYQKCTELKLRVFTKILNCVYLTDVLLICQIPCPWIPVCFSAVHYRSEMSTKLN